MELTATSMWVINGALTAATMILALMWRELGGIKKEMKDSNESIKDLAIKQTAGDTRVALLEKIIDRLPCINKVSCKD
jgi:hypothetical protein